MRTNIDSVKEQLRKSAGQSRRKGYLNDWADAMFKYYVLVLLEKIAGKKRKPSKYNLFIGKKISEGMSFSEAINEWRRKGD